MTRWCRRFGFHLDDIEEMVPYSDLEECGYDDDSCDECKCCEETKYSL